MKRERSSFINDLNLFESIKQGLEEALEYEKGDSSKVKIRKIKIKPVPHYKAQNIKDIGQKVNLFQSAFASFTGVSKKAGKREQIFRKVLHKDFWSW